MEKNIYICIYIYIYIYIHIYTHIHRYIYTHIYRLVVAKWEAGGRGMVWEFGMSRCKLVYIGWINNKVLLYSTGNYIQHPVINHNGKEYEKEYIYI